MALHHFDVEASERLPGNLTERANAIHCAMLTDLGMTGGSALRRRNATPVDGRPGMLSWHYEFTTSD
ncbi:hypothetical protein CH274_08085 [Rhodococcus sp. 06-418-5]|uniref:hypothetical protein n=1 Tax=Rhodococcus sp. 06-418-5 TaxID=2022507 RepID=UPI000B9B32DA|nr:hypothetical protein [Rhodococcus sp. 06-418-5]OZC82925.1 hypothetical protein CH274_08085 [Rhodococcus sp. 06-418-5]